jgi:hypothetical protein
MQRDDWKAGLAARQEESYRTKDGYSYKTIFDDDKLAEYGVQLWRPAPSDHFIDIIPYRMGDKDPRVLTGKAKVGSPTYLVQVYTHRGIGLAQGIYICLNRTLGKSCPICEYIVEQGSNTELDDDVINALRPSKYSTSVYNIWDRDAESKGVQVWAVSSFFMERHLQQRSVPRTGGKITFAYEGAGPDGGRHIKFTLTQKGRNQEYTGHDFEIRTTPIPKHILEQAYVLDQLLYIPTYEEVHAAFYGGENIKNPLEEQIEEVNTTDIGGERLGCEELGKNFGAYEECDSCPTAEKCKDEMESKKRISEESPRTSSSEQKKAITPQPTLSRPTSSQQLTPLRRMPKNV